MYIGIDVSQLAFPGSGVARYVRSMVESLAEYDKKNSYVLFFSSLRQSFPQDLASSLPKCFTVKTYHIPPTVLSFLWNTLHIFPIENFVGDVDIFFSSDWTEPPTRRAKKITTIHDLVTLIFPETSHPTIRETQKKRLRLVSKESNLILCDSMSTQKDVEEILGISPDRMKVLYPAVEVRQPTQKEINETMKQYNITKPYILSVGKIEPRKNLPVLVASFREMDWIGKAELLIVGPEGWGNVELDKEESPHVRFLGYVPDKDLYALYKNALFFVYPSLYEGFGYPVVEAMSLGCPVLVSEGSSLEEITGKNGVQFTPTETADLIYEMDIVYKDSQFRKVLSKRGLEHAKQFTKEVFAKKLIKIFEGLT